MSNNLYKVEKDLRSIAKRYKSIKYSIGLAILFLMLGTGAFSEEVNNVQASEVPTREEIYKAAFQEMFDTINKDINDLPKLK